MSENNLSENSKKISPSIKTFTNLLKEFPKNAAENFSYDISTLKKIKKAGTALIELTNIVEQNTFSQEKMEGNMEKGALKILSQLLEELPKDSSDEFRYDETIYRKVEAARHSIENLSKLQEPIL